VVRSGNAQSQRWAAVYESNRRRVSLKWKLPMPEFAPLLAAAKEIAETA
jgi:hypothetical protein